MSDPKSPLPVTPRQPQDPLDSKTPLLQKFGRAQRRALEGLRLGPTSPHLTPKK